jgi:hypothetical protein
MATAAFSAHKAPAIKLVSAPTEQYRNCAAFSVEEAEPGVSTLRSHAEGKTVDAIDPDTVSRSRAKRPWAMRGGKRRLVKQLRSD